MPLLAGEKRPFRCISAPVRASSSDASSFYPWACSVLSEDDSHPYYHLLNTSPSLVRAFSRSLRLAIRKRIEGSRVRARSLVRSTIHTLSRSHADHRATILYGRGSHFREPLPFVPPPEHSFMSAIRSLPVPGHFSVADAVSYQPVRGCDSRLPRDVIRASGFTSSPDRYAELSKMWPTRPQTLRASRTGRVCHVSVPKLSAQFLPLEVSGEQRSGAGQQPVPPKAPQVMRHWRRERPQRRGGRTRKRVCLRRWITPAR